jgi:single-strand DNA-binding protein
MANDLNRCEFIGRLGKDPDLRFAPSGGAVCNFSVAVGYKSKEKETTEWVRVTAFGKLAEICGEWLKKGSQIYIAGRLTTRKWQKDGVDQYTTEVVAETMQMLGKSESQPVTAKKYADVKNGLADMEDDVPF